MLQSQIYLDQLTGAKLLILKELFEYLESNEVCRIYNYSYNGLQINEAYHQRKIIKQKGSEILDWFYSKSEPDIAIKNVMYFLDTRKSLVPYHSMYCNKYNSVIVNEDCVFNKKYLKNTLEFRSNSTYGMGCILMKPGVLLAGPSHLCRPYLNFYTVLLQGENVFIKSKYTQHQRLTSNVNYFRSNLQIDNKQDSNAIVFHSMNWIFNNIDPSDNRQFYK